MSRNEQGYESEEQLQCLSELEVMEHGSEPRAEM